MERKHCDEQFLETYKKIRGDWQGLKPVRVFKDKRKEVPKKNKRLWRDEVSADGDNEDIRL